MTLPDEEFSHIMQMLSRQNETTLDEICIILERHEATQNMLSCDEEKKHLQNKSAEITTAVSVDDNSSVVLAHAEKDEVTRGSISLVSVIAMMNSFGPGHSNQNEICFSCGGKRKQ